MALAVGSAQAPKLNYYIHYYSRCVNVRLVQVAFIVSLVVKVFRCSFVEYMSAVVGITRCRRLYPND